MLDYQAKSWMVGRYALQAKRKPMSDTNSFREPGDFPETTAFERYAVKTNEKANNMHNE